MTDVPPAAPRPDALDRPSRRVFLRRAAATGAVTAWAVPSVVSVGSSALAQETQGSPAPAGGGSQTDPVTTTGAVGGTVLDAATRLALPGAAVTVGTLATTTDGGGGYLLTGVAAGEQTVTVAATGYLSADQVVEVTAGASATADFALTPTDRSVRLALTWGAEPHDLDLHLSGPKPGTTDRFHASYFHPRPVDYVSLDADDSSSYGPELMTVTASAATGAFVAGRYRVWAHNYSRTPEFDVSGARVSVARDGTQVAAYAATDATGDVALDLWAVVEFDLDAAGAVSNLTPLMTYRAGDQYTVL